MHWSVSRSRPGIFCQYNLIINIQRGDQAAMATTDPSGADYVRGIFDETMGSTDGVITEELGKSILKEYGISIPPYALATSADEAVKEAENIGFPLVMKVVSPQILHKTDVGGVKVGIDNVDDVRSTFEDM